MIVRLADMERDALAIMDGARDFVSRMDFTGWMPKTDEEFTAALSRMLAHESMEIAVCENEGRIVGGIGMMYLPCDWNPSLLVAVEKFIWCATDAPPHALLLLLRFVGKRMKHRGVAIPEFVELTSSPPGLEMVYRRMGLRPVQTVWMGVR
jgi:hypothetical protein